MRNKISIILVIFTATLVIVYFMFNDNLPPRTPHKVARLISGLPIPYDSKVIEFEDQWNDFNGNGFSYIILSIEDQYFAEIYDKAKLNAFKALPIKETIYGPLKELSDSGSKGIYKIQIENQASMSFSGAILRSDNKTVVIYLAVN